MQDEQIIRSVLDGDTQAFELLVLKYQKHIYFAAYGIIKNSSIAEELAQEAFVKAFVHLHTLKNRNGFLAWSKRIAINLALNAYDRRKWTVDVTTDDPTYDFFDNISTNETPEDYALKQELVDYLQIFIDSLPEKLRVVLVMREMEELSYDEIAGELEIPVGTVRSRLFNARQLIKDRLISQGLADGIYEGQEV